MRVGAAGSPSIRRFITLERERKKKEEGKIRIWITWYPIKTRDFVHTVPEIPDFVGGWSTARRSGIRFYFFVVWVGGWVGVDGALLWVMNREWDRTSRQTTRPDPTRPGSACTPHFELECGFLSRCRCRWRQCEEGVRVRVGR